MTEAMDGQWFNNVAGFAARTGRPPAALLSKESLVSQETRKHVALLVDRYQLASLRIRVK